MQIIGVFVRVLLRRVGVRVGVLERFVLSMRVNVVAVVMPVGVRVLEQMMMVCVKMTLGREQRHAAGKGGSAHERQHASESRAERCAHERSDEGCD